MNIAPVTQTSSKGVNRFGINGELNVVVKAKNMSPKKEGIEHLPFAFMIDITIAGIFYIPSLKKEILPDQMDDYVATAALDSLFPVAVTHVNHFITSMGYKNARMSLSGIGPPKEILEEDFKAKKSKTATGLG
ncbi:hypothetical protein A7981_08515 [Methylovorus sp. MM2]|nr:hypothetical protein A7981_08515 [Methylovorus sp. MM2]